MTRRLAGTGAAVAALLLLAADAGAQETSVEAPTPWLSEARVRATLPGGTGSGPDAAPGSDAPGATELRATYRFHPGLDTARLTAMRVEGARVEIAGAPGRRLDTLPGLLRLRVAPVSDTLTLAWRVTGEGERLPLFVPETPTRPAESLVRLEVAGATGGIAVDRVFPRMEPADGGLVGRPENLPTFLRLPSRDDGLTVDRAADGSVVILVLFATGWWLWWRWRAARRRARREEG